jgi:hypothetical protein
MAEVTGVSGSAPVADQAPVSAPAAANTQEKFNANVAALQKDINDAAATALNALIGGGTIPGDQVLAVKQALNGLKYSLEATVQIKEMTAEEHAALVKDLTAGFVQAGSAALKNEVKASGSWFNALAKAFGAVLGKITSRVIELSNRLESVNTADQGGDVKAQSALSMQLTLELGAEGKKLEFMSSSLKGVLESIGTAAKTISQ